MVVFVWVGGSEIGQPKKMIFLWNSLFFSLAAQDEANNAPNRTAMRSLGALAFNSGYHANTGIIGAVGTLNNTIFIADKLAHASIIDGLKLSGKKFERYRHNDTAHLQKLVDEAKQQGYKNIVIITEAVFSMDGDSAPLEELVKIKRGNKEVVLYVDEAHSFGLYGKRGLGLCEQCSVLNDIDIIVRTKKEVYIHYERKKTLHNEKQIRNS